MADILEAMYALQAECELGYSGSCEGAATEHDAHPYVAALGEVDETTAVIWYCMSCGEQAALDS